MNHPSLQEIESQNAFLKAELKKERKALDAFKKVVTGYSSFFYVVCIFVYYMSFTHDWYLAATTSALVAVFFAGAMAPFLNGAGVTVGIAGFGTVLAGFNMLSIFHDFYSIWWLSLSVIFLIIIAMFGFIPVSNKIDKDNLKISDLKENVKNKKLLNPEYSIHYEYCILYAKWIKNGEPEALELHNSLQRKPTVKEFLDLESVIKKRSVPPSKSDLAKSACSEIFGDYK